MKITSTAQILVNTMNAPPYTYDDLEYPPSNLDCYFGQFDGQLGDLRKIATHKAHDDYVVDAHPDGSIAYVDGDQMVYQREGKKSKVPLAKDLGKAQFDESWTTAFVSDWKTKSLWLMNPDGSQPHRGYEEQNWKFGELKSHNGKVLASIQEPNYKGSKIIEVAADGHTSRIVWELPGVPAGGDFDLSPDGSRLAYVDWTNDHVYLSSKGEKQSIQVDDRYVEADFVHGELQARVCPTFSPDGASLLYAVQTRWFDEGESTYEDHGDLFKYDLKSLEVEHLNNSGATGEIAEIFFAGPAS